PFTEIDHFDAMRRCELLQARQIGVWLGDGAAQLRGGQYQQASAAPLRALLDARQRTGHTRPVERLRGTTIGDDRLSHEVVEARVHQQEIAHARRQGEDAYDEATVFFRDVSKIDDIAADDPILMNVVDPVVDDDQVRSNLFGNLLVHRVFLHGVV